MIIVEIDVAGVERVYFDGLSDEEEARCMAIYPLVKKELRRIDKKLLDQGMKILKTLGFDEEELKIPGNSS